MRLMNWLAVGLVYPVMITPLFARSTNVPVLAAAPHIDYPPIARAARVSGQVVVEFSIDSDGHISGVHTVSGPGLLRSALESSIPSWTFRTPLPVTAQTEYRAT
jgi:TonB family protein